ncbi:hypothetical protein COP1_019764 [Malus domestica]
MSSSSHKSDDSVSSLYHQDESLSKVGYFKAAYFKISSDDLKTYRHVIPSRVRVKRVKKGSSCEPSSGARKAIKFQPYYFIQFFDLDLTINELWYFFDIGHIDEVGQLRSRHRLFDHSSKGDHDWANETLKLSRE